jgi:hypothetical protein
VYQVSVGAEPEVHVWLTLWQVEMLVELEQANGALRSELEEKEAALAALHEELEALRAGGWADLTSENEALAAEQVRWNFPLQVAPKFPPSVAIVERACRRSMTEITVRRHYCNYHRACAQRSSSTNIFIYSQSHAITCTPDT